MVRRRGATLVAIGVLWGWLVAPVMAAPSNETGEAARRDGADMYDAFRRGRLDQFASYTYPGLVQQMGGKEKMLTLLRKGLADMEKQGFRFLSGRVAAPIQIVKAGSELHALLPLTQILSAPGGELHLAGHMLGISSDGGKTWTFIDTGQLTPNNVRQVMPNFNPELKLPARSEPKWVPKK